MGANTEGRRRLRLGMVGGGQGAFIGAVHRIAARLDDHYGLVAGALLHAAFLMFYGGLMALPQILIFSVLCGGGYGATCAFLFVRWDGLRLPNDEQGSGGKTAQPQFGLIVLIAGTGCLVLWQFSTTFH